MVKRAVGFSMLMMGLALTLGAGSGRAQEADAPAKAKAEPVVAYRLDFSVNELEEGKKLNSRQYSMHLNSDDSNEIKIGTRVPVPTGPVIKDNPLASTQFQYLDVGTKIYCRLTARGNDLLLTVHADISNFATPEGQNSLNVPVVRQFTINASTIALLGKAMVVGSVDDPGSKRQFQLEVTVTKLR